MVEQPLRDNWDHPYFLTVVAEYHKRNETLNDNLGNVLHISSGCLPSDNLSGQIQSAKYMDVVVLHVVTL